MAETIYKKDFYLSQLRPKVRSVRNSLENCHLKFSNLGFSKSEFSFKRQVAIASHFQGSAA